MKWIINGAIMGVSLMSLACSMEVTGKLTSRNLASVEDVAGDPAQEGRQAGWGLADEGTDGDGALVTLRTGFVAEAQDIPDSEGNLFVTSFGQFARTVSEDITD